MNRYSDFYNDPNNPFRNIDMPLNRFYGLGAATPQYYIIRGGMKKKIDLKKLMFGLGGLAGLAALVL